MAVMQRDVGAWLGVTWFFSEAVEVRSVSRDCSGPSFVLGNSLLAALPPLFGKYEVSFAVPLFFIQCDRA